ncbi:MAG: hypothetical protein A3J75_05570 [Acidobacteria bacterium RBG_16_68_9]|nr:MAG: hypothetical protein A3J75_05570 [Acidobacteria bacterium RBG_16_68_9]
MVKRRLRIGIRARKDSYAAALQSLRRVEAGDVTAHEPGLYFESIADLRRFLTPKRLNLLVAILREAPRSVTELAKLMKRDLKNVSNDLALLHQLGLVDFAPGVGHGNSRAPRVPYDEIDLKIDLRALAEKRRAA